MINPFSSLFGKILFWFFLNLIVLAAVVLAFVVFPFQVDLSALFGRRVLDRMRTSGMLISHDLNQTPKTNWSDVLSRYAQIHQVDFVVVLKDGSRYASKQIELPETVQKIVQKALQHTPPLPGAHLFAPGQIPEGSGSTRDRDRHSFQPPINFERPKQRPPFIIRTKHPTLYWSWSWMPMVSQSRPHPTPGILLVVSKSFTGNGFFFDPLPWMLIVLLAIFISVVLWIPLVRNITRPIAHITRTAEQIALGRFDVAIQESRTDEIGRLANAINYMTSRLQGYIKGQKRFLGDAAHELGSPIARIQVGLGILEQRLPEENQQQLADVTEDVAHMSNLVNELLSFSRADMNTNKISVEAVTLLPVVQQIVQRECVPAPRVITRIDPG
jgi:two-component system sensor histidine kinase CpxA